MNANNLTDTAKAIASAAVALASESHPVLRGIIARNLYILVENAKAIAEAEERLQDECSCSDCEGVKP